MNKAPRHTLSSRHSSIVLLLVFSSLSVLLSSPHVHGASKLLDVNFNDFSNATTSLNYGTFGNSVTLVQSSGTATDLHSASGGGASGLAGDYSFNNTASTGMGSSGTGGAVILTNGSTMFSGLKSFTISGWYKTDGSSVAGNYARLLEAYNSNIGLYLSGSGGLQLAVKGSSSKNATITNTAYSAAGSWVFFAVTYDGTLSSANYTAYFGTTSSTASSAGSADMAAGTVATATGDLFIGNASTGSYNRTFDGSLDNFAIYGSTTDNTGALNLSDVEALRVSALAIPEPTSVTLLSIALLSLLILKTRKNQKKNAILS